MTVESVKEEREPTRCFKCGKRVARLGIPWATKTRCPEEAESAATCSLVLDQLVTARQLVHTMGKTAAKVHDENGWHPETTALLNKAGLTLVQLDTEIIRRDRIQQETHKLNNTLSIVDDRLQEWIREIPEFGEERALILAKWALDQIDISAGGTRTIPEMHEASEKIAKEIGEHAERLWDKDWEMGE